MIRYTFLMLFTGIIFGAFAQSLVSFNMMESKPAHRVTVFYESFDSPSFPPENWVSAQLGTSEYGWEWADWTSYAGPGSAYSNWDIDPIDAWLITPQITLEAGGNYSLSFYQRNYGMQNYQYSAVMLSTGNSEPGSSDFVEIYEAYSSFAAFGEVVVDLTAFAGQSFHLAFVHQGTAAHEWVVDELTINEIQGVDAGMSGLVSPQPLSAPGLHDVVAEVENFGTMPVTALDIHYDINGATGSLAWEGTLLPGETTAVSIFNDFDFTTTGVYEITLIAQLDGDLNPFNDTLQTAIIASPACSFSVFMTNVNGTGFHGAVIGFRQQGVLTATFGEEFSNGHTYGPVQVALADDFETEIVAINQGDFPSTIGFTIIGPQGDTIHHRSFGQPFSTGFVFDVFQTDCTMLDYDAAITGLEIEVLYVSEAVAPKAIVANYGSNPATFQALLEVVDEQGAVAETQSIQVTNLPSGMTDTISFAPFYTSPGKYFATASIVWDDDQNPANNQVMKHFDSFDGMLIHYDDGENADIVGWSVLVWDAAILVEPDELFGEITHLRVYIGQQPSSATLKIWQGIEGEFEVWSQPFEPTPSAWNIIELDEPYRIAPELDLYVGVRIEADALKMVLGVDKLLDYPEKGDLFRPDGAGPWFPTYFKDWNIQFIFNPDDDHHTVAFIVSGSDGNPIENALVTLEGFGWQTTTAQGHAVFLNIPPTPAPGIPFTIETEDYAFYQDWVIVDEDTTVEVTLMTVNVDEIAGNLISVYPNPTQKMLTLDAGDQIVKSIIIVDMSGNKYHLKPSRQIDVSGFERGTYILQVATSQTILTKKIILD